MLADSSPLSLRSGMLSSDVHLPASSIEVFLDFVGNELPRWRDRPDRHPESAETILTSQLCAHLNSAARHSSGLDILQFRPEESDDQQKGRKIDLVLAPCGVTIWIDGRSYSDFEPLIPIECKRLPTPKGANRDEREYVINRHATTGGIQRFKCGQHGSSHAIGAMIAYVQEEDTITWFDRVAKWIAALAATGADGWTSFDAIQLVTSDTMNRMCVLRSEHRRATVSSPIRLRHMWLEMN